MLLCYININIVIVGVDKGIHRPILYECSMKNVNNNNGMAKISQYGQIVHQNKD